MVSRHADKHSLRSHPKESQAARGDWIQNSKGYVLKMRINSKITLHDALLF